MSRRHRPTLGQDVWNDLQPTFAGLGVGPLDGIPSDADQIEGSEILTITFSAIVNVAGYRHVVRLTDHTPFGTGYSDNTNITGTAAFLLNGVRHNDSVVSQLLGAAR